MSTSVPPSSGYPTRRIPGDHNQGSKRTICAVLDYFVFRSTYTGTTTVNRSRSREISVVGKISTISSRVVRGFSRIIVRLYGEFSVGKYTENSGKIAKKRNFPENSEKFSGKFPEYSRLSPGKTKIPGKF
jgi:hypothetical protein